MREDTLKALRSWRASKALALDKEKFLSIVEDIKRTAAEELWSASEKRAASKGKAQDALLVAAKAALAKYKAPISTKAQRLTQFLLPDREGPPPRGMPAALRLLRSYLTDEEILVGAHELMSQIRAQVGTDVPL